VDAIAGEHAMDAEQRWRYSTKDDMHSFTSAARRFRFLILCASLGSVGLVGGCAKEGSCLGGGDATVARYNDCIAKCKQGNDSACNRRSALEGGLSTICHRSGNTAACKALCTGRRADQAACKRWRELKRSN
jgi:hypothetical protein